MRKLTTLGVVLTGTTLAWWLALPEELRIFPLVDAQGAPSGLWVLRQQALYLSGIWSIALMTLCMLLALRMPSIEAPLGGMDQVYRLHKWAGIGAGVTAVLHWGAKESGGWIKGVWGSLGRPAKDAVLPWAVQFRSPAKEVGEWAFYILLALIVLTLWQQLVSYRKWRWTHRLMPLIYLALVFHSVMLMPLAFWTEPLGLMMLVCFVVGSVASVISLLGRVGQARSHQGSIHSIAILGDTANNPPIEVICAVADAWPGHKPGQFVYATFDRWEGAHPFTIASAPKALGQSEFGEELLRMVIKPLGDYTSALAQQLQPGQAVRLEGPYGCFDASGQADRQQVWVAAGVGITPFMSLLESRQGAAAVRGESIQMHYCTRNALEDTLLPRVRQLCQNAQPPVLLNVHDASRGDLFSPELLKKQGNKPLDIWFCGPQGLATSLQRACRSVGMGRWKLHHELFAMR